MPLYLLHQIRKNCYRKGRVINPITGAGIQDAEMILQRGTAGLPGGNKTVKNVHTDAEATSIT